MPGSRQLAVARVVNAVFLAIGVGALVWMARAFGTQDLVDALTSVGYWAIPIFGVSVTAVFLNAAAIHNFMRPEQRMVSYWRVVLAQLSGQAVNSVTPMGMLGEVVKATMLIGRVPRYRAISSVVAYSVCNTIATVIFLLFALAVCLVHQGFPREVEILVGIGFALLFLATVSVLLLIRRGLLRSIVGGARAVRLLSAERREKLAQRLEALDTQLSMFRGDNLQTYWPGFVFIALARIIGWFDLWLILTALGHSHGFTFTVIAAAAGMFVTTIARVVPLGIGAGEGGQAALFGLLGAGAMIGLALTLLRRIRTLAVAVVGLSAMMLAQLVERISDGRTRARVRARHEEQS